MVITSGMFAASGGSGPRVSKVRVDEGTVLRFVREDGSVVDVPLTAEQEEKYDKEMAFQQAYEWYDGPIAP